MKQYACWRHLIERGIYQSVVSPYGAIPRILTFTENNFGNAVGNSSFVIDRILGITAEKKSNNNRQCDGQHIFFADYYHLVNHPLN
jgi:hypothetical protein